MEGNGGGNCLARGHKQIGFGRTFYRLPYKSRSRKSVHPDCDPTPLDLHAALSVYVGVRLSRLFLPVNKSISHDHKQFDTLLDTSLIEIVHLKDVQLKARGPPHMRSKQPRSWIIGGIGIFLGTCKPRKQGKSFLAL